MEAAQERRLGDYLLQQAVAESPLARTWRAVQETVGRPVLIDELREEQAAASEAFLADVRAKAAVDHPLIASVYEAVSQPGCWFFAYELLPGETLERRRQAGQTFAPRQLLPWLGRIAEASIALEARGIANRPLGLEAVFVDDHGVVRLQNLAIAGERGAEQSERDLRQVGNEFPALVAAGQPGASRLLTVLSWMRGEGDAAIGWEHVCQYCDQIELQLAEPLAATGSLPGAAARRRRLSAAAGWITAGGVVLLAGIGWWRMSRTSPEPPAARLPLPAEVVVPAGTYLTPDGEERVLAGFRISAHETTIGEYAKFLETLRVLAKEGKDRSFDHPEQPAEKVSHEPDDWRSLLTAAQANAVWKGQPVALETPVVGVDWWDATAYAIWRKASLPTQEQWFAALGQQLEQPASLAVGKWQPVTAETPDRTPSGLLGMAGSVSEWMALPAANPDNPLGTKLWVILGGSQRQPQSGALTREWTEDRSLRRPDLGFRLVFPE